MGELPTGFTVSTALNRLTHTPPGLPDDEDDHGDDYDHDDDYDDDDYDPHARLPEWRWRWFWWLFLQMMKEPGCGLNFSCCGRTNGWWLCGLQSDENKCCTDCCEKDNFDQPGFPHHVPTVKIFLFRTSMVSVFGVPEFLTCHYLHSNQHWISP